MSAIQEKTAVTEKYLSLFGESKAALNEGSSPLLNRMRDIAMKRFGQAGVPDYKNEDYKYTNLKPAFDKSYRPALVNQSPIVNLHDIFRCDVPELDAYTILTINGWYYSGNTELAGLPNGVVVGSLQQIANERPELVENYLNRQAALSNDPIVALNTAFAQDGFFLFVPKSAEIEKPIQVINLMLSEESLMVTQRNLIVAEDNSRVKIIFCDHTLSASEFLYNSVTEMFVGQDAVADFYTIQNQHNNSVSVNSGFFKQGANSNLMAFNGVLHGGLVRNNVNVQFAGEHSEANVYGMSFTDKKQHVDNFTYIDHASANCLSDQVYKNVLNEESTGAFAGRIHVARDAQKTNAFQRNNNVLLSDKARMQTKPQLIIDADDVKCSHGATVGQIDREALFFMRSRGIGESEARVMLMNAFAYEVIQKIRIEPLRDRIGELVEKRLKGEISHCHECEYKCDC